MRTRGKPPRQCLLVLDQNAASLRWDEERILGFDMYPGCRETCDRARDRGIDTVLAIPVRPDNGMPKQFAQSDFPVVALGTDFRFIDAFETAKDVSDAVLIAADRKLRGQGRKAGMMALPHVALLDFVLEGERPRAVRLQGAHADLLRFNKSAEAIPMHFQPAPEGGWAWIGLVSNAAVAKASAQGLRLSPLSYDVETDDLLWARIDHDDAETRAALKRRKILHSEQGQVLIALGPDEDPEALGLHGEHGHAQLLSPMPHLLDPVRRAEDDTGETLRVLRDFDVLTPVNRIDLEDLRRLLLTRCSSVTSGYVDDLDRYTGVSSLDAGGTIESRHILHPDNERAETQLLADLQAMGYCAVRHDFQHAGRTHSNIIADLPGKGRQLVHLDWVDRWRQILLRAETDRLRSADLEVISALLQRLPKDTLSLTAEQVSRRIAELASLRPWFPWWCLRTPIPGFGAGLVIVGCHMDSTAGLDSGYSPTTDPAPGRDDDGSGLAGVLSIARHMASMRGELTHTVRFCFFNAEEAGLVGSQAYASMLKAQGAPVIAAICMDMIGYNTDSHRLWEIHAGYTDPAVRDVSVPYADRIAAAGLAYGTLSPAQIYKGTSAFSGAPDRNLYDGAINRSDHASFHQQGWPAVVVSEDFFINLASEPAADSNVNYHRATDTLVDTDYARDIVCAVARAVVEIAA